jgi:hypothetical protein
MSVLCMKVLVLFVVYESQSLILCAKGGLWEPIQNLGTYTRSSHNLERNSLVTSVSGFEQRN